MPGVFKATEYIYKNHHTIDPIPHKADKTYPVFLLCQVTFFENGADVFVVDRGKVSISRK